MSTSVASVVSHFPSAENGFTTTTSGSVSSGAATVGLNSVAGYTNGEVVVFVIDPTDASKKQTFTGIMDTGGSQVTSVVWTAGTNQTHSAGATVVDYATATHISMMTKGLLVEHAQTGLHTLTSSATITSAKHITGINDTNGNELFKLTATGSAVNEFTVANAATGNNPVLSATGGDTNVGMTFTPKGTGNISMTSRADGWVTGLTAPSTVTANGNRSYNLTIASTDYTDRLSAGMRLKLTRTVTAPTQCTDLESGSSNYYSKSSPNKCTFTDDFVVSAWVKLESYQNPGVILSRYNGTSGWRFNINSSGQLELVGFNAGAGNNSYVQSYQSVPLNRWVHVAAQLDMSAFTATTTTSYIMIDGIDVPATVARNGTNPTALVQAGNLEVGSNNGGTNPFDGKLAQVAYYTAKVTQATILASIDRTLSGTETSLGSAYSFSNSITDLNTTTPNDLTAQNSAVATNADTPFSGGSGGTTEYALVMSASFSTDTTLVVQVPEGYAIPTTGGVSALAYSTHKSPQGFPTHRGKWRVQSLIKATYTQSGPTSGTWYNIGSTKLAIPIGDWVVGYQGHFDGVRTLATAGPGVQIFTTLSTATNTEADQNLSCYFVNRPVHGSNFSSNEIGTALNKSEYLSLSSLTNYYLNMMQNGGDTTTVLTINASTTTTSNVSVEPSGLQNV